MMSENTNKLLMVSNCHHAAILEINGNKFCATCKCKCIEVEYLIEKEEEEE